MERLQAPPRLKLIACIRLMNMYIHVCSSYNALHAVFMSSRVNSHHFSGSSLSCTIFVAGDLLNSSIVVTTVPKAAFASYLTVGRAPVLSLSVMGASSNLLRCSFFRMPTTRSVTLKILPISEGDASGQLSSRVELSSAVGIG